MSVPNKPLKIAGACPKCEEMFFFPSELTSFKDVEGGTLDCNKCGALLLIKDGLVYPFHEKLHEENPQWPKDGTGTASIGV